MDTLTNLQVYRFETLMIPCPDVEAPAATTVVELHNDGNLYDGLLLPEAVIYRAMHAAVGIATAVQTDPDGPLLVSHFKHTQDQRALSLLCAHLTPVPGSVHRIRDLVACIQSQPIRDFVEQALSTHDAITRYWSCPASRNHHHAYPGGLAAHSAEVASNAARATEADADQHDLAIAYGLLHDYGKLWTCWGTTPSAEAKMLDHETIGYEKLMWLLMWLLMDLQRQCEDAALALRCLLSGEWRRATFRRNLAVARIVNGCDQASAEADMATNGPKGRRPWRPQLVK